MPLPKFTKVSVYQHRKSPIQSHNFDGTNINNEHEILDNSDSESDEFAVDIEPEIIDLTGGNNAEIDIDLPPQMRCAVYQLNLVYTSDLAEYLKEKQADTIYVNTFNKLTLFWNKTKRSGRMKEKVKVKCGRQFPIPVNTRWSSLYDAMKAILSKKSGI